MKRDPAPHQIPPLAPQTISQDVLREKYLKPGEKTEADLLRRVARALASVEAEPLRELCRNEGVELVETAAKT